MTWKMAKTADRINLWLSRISFIQIASDTPVHWFRINLIININISRFVMSILEIDFHSNKTNLLFYIIFSFKISFFVSIATFVCLHWLFLNWYFKLQIFLDILFNMSRYRTFLSNIPSTELCDLFWCMDLI
jgi:hypothetical protein